MAALDAEIFHGKTGYRTFFAIGAAIVCPGALFLITFMCLLRACTARRWLKMVRELMETIIFFTLFVIASAALIALIDVPFYAWMSQREAAVIGVAALIYSCAVLITAAHLFALGERHA